MYILNLWTIFLTVVHSVSWGPSSSLHCWCCAEPYKTSADSAHSTWLVHAWLRIPCLECCFAVIVKLTCSVCCCCHFIEHLSQENSLNDLKIKGAARPRKEGQDRNPLLNSLVLAVIYAWISYQFLSKSVGVLCSLWRLLPNWHRR